MDENDSLDPDSPTLYLIYPVGENVLDVTEYAAAIGRHTEFQVILDLDCPEESCQTWTEHVAIRTSGIFDIETNGVIVYPGWQECAASVEAIRTAFRAGIPIYRLGMGDDGPEIFPRISVVGISGWAQAGKDTTADILVRDHGYRKASFADALRTVVERVDPIISDEGVRYNEALEALGYEETKRRYPESRRVLQRLGTEGIRDTLDEMAWTTALYLSCPDADRVVIPDVRFPNEISFVHQNYGPVFWIQRPGVDAPPFQHASETSISAETANYVLENAGTEIDLARIVSEVIRDARESGGTHL